MGAKTSSRAYEYARRLNISLGVVAALLAAIFSAWGWLYPFLIALFFGVLISGIATLNLAPHEQYLRRLVARGATVRTGLLIVLGQFVSILWLIPLFYGPEANRDPMRGVTSALLLTLIIGVGTLFVALISSLFGEKMSRGSTPVILPAKYDGEFVSHPDWLREQRPIEAPKFSPGANHDFGWYFEGELKTSIESLYDILSFLKECEYVTDKHLFMQDDFWQHPVTFEQIRKGDCEDSALWAWRKLKELGYEAELVSGIFLKSGGHHAWVHVTIDGIPFVYETTRKRSYPLIPMSEAVAIYRPHVAVDHRLVTYRYAGADKPKPKPIENP